MYSALVIVHVAAGTIGLLLAGPVVLVPKRPGWHHLLGRTYLVNLLVMTTTALALVAYDPAGLVGFSFLAVGTLAAGAGGLFFAVRRPRGWLPVHLNLMGSSVIAFVTAFLVQVADGHLVAWLLPTIVGSPLIGWQIRRVVRRSSVAVVPDPLSR